MDSYLNNYMQNFPLGVPCCIVGIMLLFGMFVIYIYERYNTSKPLSPYEAEKKRIKYFPAYVIDAINELLVLHSNGQHYIEINQEEIIKKIISKAPATLIPTRSQVFEKKLLNFEQIFKLAGWNVKCNKSDVACTYIFERTPVEQGDPVTGF